MTLKEKVTSTPASVKLVLTIEWILSLAIIIWILAVLMLKITRKGVIEGTSSDTQDDIFTLEKLIISLTLTTLVVVLSLVLIVLLGKGIVLRNPTNCKIWLICSSLIFVGLLVTFGYCLPQNYFANLYFLAAILILTYKLFSFIAVAQFIRQLQSELADQIKLCPSTIL